MGQIQIQMRGSFPKREFSTTAEMGGHAFAIQRAIEWLNNKLPEAIQKDHALHAKGDHPPQSDFGETPNIAAQTEN